MESSENWGKNADRLIFTLSKYWSQLLAWNRSAAREGIRKRVFCASMCDIMERNNYVGSYVPTHVHSDRFVFRPGELTLDHARQRTFELIEQTDSLDWLLLTKRPHEYVKLLPKSWLKEPRQNVWLMTTVETQDYVYRIEQMMHAPAIVYGVSVEPMLGSVKLPNSFLKLGNRAWVIVGGESGHRSRPTQPNWFRHIRDTCVDAGVPFFFKQWGRHNGDLVQIRTKHFDGYDELDGRKWKELPLGREK
jgi:protein gp37